MHPSPVAHRFQAKPIATIATSKDYGRDTKQESIPLALRNNDNILNSDWGHLQRRTRLPMLQVDLQPPLPPSPHLGMTNGGGGGASRKAADQTVPIRRPSYHSKPFWTDELTDLRDETVMARRRCRDHFRRFRAPNPTLVTDLKHAENVFTRAYKRTRNQYYRGKLANAARKQEDRSLSTGDGPKAVENIPPRRSPVQAARRPFTTTISARL